MRLIINSSSSSGNSYILDSGTQFLLIEAGVKTCEIMKSIKRRSDKIAGALISHIHSDHAKYVPDLIKRGIRVYGNESVASSFPGTYTLNAGKWKNIGDFSVIPFLCMHDVPNYGFVITHPDMRPLLFGTDTYAYPAIYKGIGNFLIEANYDDALLDKSDISQALRNRLLTSHMSLDYCIRYLSQCDASKAQNIVLTHLSARHSDATMFKKKVQQTFGVPVTIADKGININISKPNTNGKNN